MMTLQMADNHGLAWAQEQVSRHHYLHRPVDARCSVFAYLVLHHAERVGCLIFGRPEATACYQGLLTYGSVADVANGRAQYSRWEILNLARVWLDPHIQANGKWHIPHAATQVIGMALQRIVVDYMLAYPPIYVEQPWRIRQVLSYCDTRVHRGTIYRAAGFSLMRTNTQGIQTWARLVRGLQGHERQAIEKHAAQSMRSRRYRARVITYQEVLWPA